jgi:hypothetical protein
MATRRDRTLRQMILARIRHDGGGGRAGKVELAPWPASWVPVASSPGRSVRDRLFVGEAGTWSNVKVSWRNDTFQCPATQPASRQV